MWKNIYFENTAQNLAYLLSLSIISGPKEHERSWTPVLTMPNVPALSNTALKQPQGQAGWPWA